MTAHYDVIRTSFLVGIQLIILILLSGGWIWFEEPIKRCCIATTVPPAQPNVRVLSYDTSVMGGRLNVKGKSVGGLR